MSTPKTQIRLSQLTGSFGLSSGQINDHVNSGAAVASGSIDVDSLDGALSYMAAAIKRIHGHDTSFSSAAEGTFHTDILPSSSGAQDLGSTGAEFGDVFIADTKALKLGSAQEHTIADTSSGLEIDSSQAIAIESSGGAISLGGDAVAQAINIGSGAAARTITVGNAASTAVN